MLDTISSVHAEQSWWVCSRTTYFRLRSCLEEGIKDGNAELHTDYNDYVLNSHPGPIKAISQKLNNFTKWKPMFLNPQSTTQVSTFMSVCYRLRKLENNTTFWRPQNC